MPLVILTVIVQACFIFHVFKTGRPYWWAYVILGFPVLGCVIYYFVEVFPGSREHYAANRASREIARALDPEKELRRCMEAVEISPTVQNRVALADTLLEARLGQSGVFGKGDAPQILQAKSRHDRPVNGIGDHIRRLVPIAAELVLNVGRHEALGPGMALEWQIQ